VVSIAVPIADLSFELVEIGNRQSAIGNNTHA
jgi:hypothetical protein